MPEWQQERTRIFGNDSIAIEVATRRNAKSERLIERVEVLNRWNRKKRAILPVPPVDPDAGFAFDRFVISPDKRAILVDRKVCSGTNEAFLLEKVAGLQYRLADQVSLNDRIGQAFGLPRELVGNNGKQYTQSVDFLLFQRWIHDGREGVIACLYGPRNAPVCYFVTLNTNTGRLFDYHRVKDRDVSTRYVR